MGRFICAAWSKGRDLYNVALSPAGLKELCSTDFKRFIPENSDKNDNENSTAVQENINSQRGITSQTLTLTVQIFIDSSNSKLQYYAAKMIPQSKDHRGMLPQK